MISHQASKPSLIVHLWQRLPWIALFWALVAGLFGAAAWFAVEVERHNARLHRTDEQVELESGDSVKVAVILNGDEVIVESKGSGNTPARSGLRMLGIRSFDPVVNEFEITAFGRASVAFLTTWVLNKPTQVTFDKPKRDVHNRYLAYLSRDGIDINRRMVEEGIAMVYTEFPFAREADYLSAEVLARAAGRGIWGGERTRKRIIGLRADWAAKRRERDGSPPVDPLLLEQP